MMPRVPLANPSAETAPYREAILEATARVLDGGYYILGPEVRAFEEAMTQSLGVQGCCGVASGTDALALALTTLGVGSGDEVITVSHTAGPTVAAILMTGATPVLVDIEEDSYCISPAAIAQAITPRTRAVIAVHLYGHPADMPAILAAAGDIPVIEDCAQAQGARLNGLNVGSIGTMGCFSFYPTKNLGAIGDGGAVSSNDASLLERLRQLRLYGWKTSQYAEVEKGRCSRLDELQAAILSVKLPHLEQAIARRRSIASRYQAGLSDLPLILPREREGAHHAYHLYVIRTQARELLESALSAAQIGHGRHYPWPIHRQPAFAAKARIAGSLAVTERLGGEILSLPVYSVLSEDQVDIVIETVRSALT